MTDVRSTAELMAGLERANAALSAAKAEANALLDDLGTVPEDELVLRIVKHLVDVDTRLGRIEKRLDLAEA